MVTRDVMEGAAQVITATGLDIRGWSPASTILLVTVVILGMSLVLLVHRLTSADLIAEAAKWVRADSALRRAQAKELTRGRDDDRDPLPPLEDPRGGRRA